MNEFQTLNNPLYSVLQNNVQIPHLPTERYWSCIDLSKCKKAKAGTVKSLQEALAW